MIGYLSRAGAALMLLLALAVCVPAAHAQDGEATSGEAARSLDLTTFLGLVEENSLRLQAIRTDRELAEVQEDLARSQMFPVIGGEAGYTRNFLDIEQEMPVAASTLEADPTTGAAPLITQPIDVNQDNELSLGLSVQQTVFDMTVFRALEASRQFTGLTSTAYEASRQAILTEAKRLYFQVLLLEEVLAVRRSSEEIARDNYRDTQRREENGLASPLELLQAEVNWKITQPDTSQAQRNLNIALQNLKDFAGIPQDAELELGGNLDAYPQLPSFEGAFADRTARPDYRALLAERELRDINVDAERAKFYPTLSTSFTYGREMADDGFDFSDGTDVLTAGLTLTVPIFYGSSRFASLQQAQLELRQAETSIRQKDEEIATELETVRLTLQEADLRIESAEQTLATAERAYEVSQTSVENGLATQLELKDARVSLEQARLNYLSAVFDYLSAYFDWQLAVGRGDEVPQP